MKAGHTKDFEALQKKIKQLLVKAREETIASYGLPAVTVELYNKQLGHYRSRNKEIAKLAKEINEAIKNILDGEAPEVEIRLPHKMLRDPETYLHIIYKTLAVYRYQAYKEVQRLIQSPLVEESGQHKICPDDIERIKAKLSLKDIYKRVFSLYLLSPRYDISETASQEERSREGGFKELTLNEDSMLTARKLKLVHSTCKQSGLLISVQKAHDKLLQSLIFRG